MGKKNTDTPSGMDLLAEAPPAFSTRSTPLVVALGGLVIAL